MLYNTTHRFTKFIESPSQEDIYNCPFYFSMSYEQIKKSGAPDFLIKLLDQFPFDGRKNIIQARVQDFRDANAPIDGRHWHTDYNARMIDGEGKEVKAWCKHRDDFHLMLASWGAGCCTQFMDDVLDLPDNLGQEWGEWQKQLDERVKEPLKISTAAKGQMVEYTSRDIHRADGVLHEAGVRLMIVAFDCDDIDGNVRVLPSIRERDKLNGK